MFGLTRQYLMIGGGIALLLAFAGTYFYGRSNGAHAERAKWEIVQAKETKARAEKEAEYRAEEQRRVKAQQEIANNALLERDKARADADAAADAGRMLRAKIRNLTLSAAASNQSTPAGSEAADTAADMLDRLFGRLEEAENGIARYADDAAIAGRACEASYDSLETE